MDIDPYKDPMAPYGLDKEDILAIGEEEEGVSGYISEKLNILKAQIVWAVRKEMARTIEDVLARRTRALFLDARESIRIAPETALIIANELNRDEMWVERQIEDFKRVAKNYYFED
ncbi:MAG TPA: glycerol-3-phosphate dehydrogenase C-terminal domain-containing protein, partial [Draconibacterium sp.]|nr:glycerol-3-phosphate dehydrogenase C-terminal domain-containing protein [Draconibacterium sp.]